MGQIDRHWETADLTRRALEASVTATGFVGGFAAAVQLVVAKTMIVTVPGGWQRMLDWFRSNGVA